MIVTLTTFPLVIAAEQNAADTNSATMTTQPIKSRANLSENL